MIGYEWVLRWLGVFKNKQGHITGTGTAGAERIFLANCFTMGPMRSHVLPMCSVRCFIILQTCYSYSIRATAYEYSTVGVWYSMN